MPIAQKLREFLDQNGVQYQVHGHREVYTAQEVAQVEHIPGKELAKVVMLRGGSDFFMVALPAPHQIDLARAKKALGKKNLALATEDEFAGLFPGCEPGAMPPFGNLYEVPVWIDQSLAEDEEIVFNAGTHRDTVRMKYADFVRLVQPKVALLRAEK